MATTPIFGNGIDSGSGLTVSQILAMNPNAMFAPSYTPTPTIGAGGTGTTYDWSGLTPQIAQQIQAYNSGIGAGNSYMPADAGNGQITYVQTQTEGGDIGNLIGMALAGGVGGLALAGAGLGAAGGATGAFDMGGMGSATNLFTGASPTFAGSIPNIQSLYQAAGGGSAVPGYDYDSFLQSIGVDPASTQFAGGTMSNADIMGAINGGAAGLTPSLSDVGNIAKIAQVLGLGAGGGAPGATGSAGAAGGGGGFNLGSLLPLLGVGSGLNTMFNQKPAVDPAMVNALWQAGQNTYQTALDPQRALYNQTLGDVQDQVRTADSLRGIAMSPTSAGNEADAISKFNIDWQNAQLGRQLSGLQGFAQSGNTAANAGVAGAAQQFAQNQTGLNNLTTGLGQIFGTPGTNIGGLNFGGSAPNGIGSWLNNLFSSGGGAAGGSGGSTAGFVPPYQADLFTPTGNFGGADIGGVGSGPY